MKRKKRISNIRKAQTKQAKQAAALALSCLLTACGESSAPAVQEATDSLEADTSVGKIISEPQTGTEASNTESAVKESETVSEAISSPETTSQTAATAISEGTEEKPITSAEAAENNPEMQQKDFSVSVIRKAIENKTENAMLSPLSLKLVMNMAVLGAADGSDTEKQILDALGCADKNDVRSKSGRIMKELHRPLAKEDEEAPMATGIEINNSIWTDTMESAVKIDPAYIDDIRSSLNAELFETDLQADSIVPELNGWVSDKTHKLIPNMISEPFEESCNTLLINTLYFKNRWAAPFEKMHTYEEVFHGTSDASSTDFMHRTSRDIMYKESTAYRSVSLDYTDSTAMKIFIPTSEEDYIGDIIGQMSDSDIMNDMLADNYSEAYVRLSIPKFETETSLSLRSYMASIGITDALSGEKADFSVMTADDTPSDYRLYIGDIIQSSKIICDEDGTEAAAATMAMLMRNAAMIDEPEPPIEFKADKPFLYVIQDINTSEILFAGIINNFS